MGDKCFDNRFEIIDMAKRHLLKATNIECSKDEMACLDSFLFRCWQMGWLKQYRCGACKHLIELEPYLKYSERFVCDLGNAYEKKVNPDEDLCDKWKKDTRRE